MYEDKIIRVFFFFISNSHLQRSLLCVGLLCSLGNAWVEYTVHKIEKHTTLGIVANISSVILYVSYYPTIDNGL